MKKFVYLVSIISKNGGPDKDIQRRILIAQQNVWRSNQISVRFEIRIFTTNVKSVLLFRSET